MEHRFRQSPSCPSIENLPRPLPAHRTAPRKRGWIQAYDARLRSWCQGDEVLLRILRFASVPMAIGLVLVLLAIIL